MNGQLLFAPWITARTLSGHSEEFQVPTGQGGQVTVIGAGWDAAGPSAAVGFEIIYSQAVAPDYCKCPPGRVELPGITASAILALDCQPVTLDLCQPFAVIDAPQGAMLRAFIVGAEDMPPEELQDILASLIVWTVESSTAAVSDKLRGYRTE